MEEQCSCNEDVLSERVLAKSEGGADPLSSQSSEYDAMYAKWESEEPPADELERFLPFLVQAIKGDNLQHKLKAVCGVRRILSEPDPPIRKVIDTQIVPDLVSFLTAQESSFLQFESAWALTNLATGDHEELAVIVREGAIPAFVDLLRSDNASVQEQAVWALGNIAGDSVGYRDAVLSTSALNDIVEILSKPGVPLSMLRTATWAISNFMRGKPRPPLFSIISALPILVQLINSTDTEVLTDACWAISYISDGDGDVIQRVIDSGVCPTLINLLGSNSSYILVPALRSVGNIVTGDENQTQVMLACNVLARLRPLLQHPYPNISKEACWTLSNITAGNPLQVEQVIQSGVLPDVIAMSSNSSLHIDIRREAIWAISNATTFSMPEHIDYLVDCKAVEALIGALGVDVKTTRVALEGLENTMKAAARLVPINDITSYLIQGQQNGESVKSKDKEQGYEEEEEKEKEFMDISEAEGEGNAKRGCKRKKMDVGEEEKSKEQEAKTKEQEEEEGAEEGKVVTGCCGVGCCYNSFDAVGMECSSISGAAYEDNQSKRSRILTDQEEEEHGVAGTMMALSTMEAKANRYVALIKELGGVQKMKEILADLELGMDSKDSMLLELPCKQQQQQQIALCQQHQYQQQQTEMPSQPPMFLSGHAQLLQAIHPFHTDNTTTSSNITTSTSTAIILPTTTPNNTEHDLCSLFNYLCMILENYFDEPRRYNPKSLLDICLGYVRKNKVTFVVQFDRLPLELREMLENDPKPMKRKILCI